MDTASGGDIEDADGVPPLPMFVVGVRVFHPHRGIGEVLGVDRCDGCPTIAFKQTPPARYGWQEFRDADVVVLGHPTHAATT